ncbi:hypothetical protein [Spiroplasma endosymbiont of Panzeria rudis]
MILDWPDEIGTLPPEALQNNPQIGDFTHAPTCDFSAKQQKRITTNENEITKLNSELTKTNENIDDIKNNWFNIETSPLWKKVENNNIEMLKWYFIKISYQYSTENNFMKFYKIIKIYLNNIFHEFELLNVDSMTYKEQIQNKNILNIGTIYYDNRNKKFSGGGNSYPERGKINLIGDIQEIYQYQGIDTPTEFITEESTEHDYYTKLETNNLLDKKQNINDDALQTVSKQIVPAINEINNKIPNLSDYYKKEEVDKKLEDVKSQFPIAFQINAISAEIPNLETTDKTIAGAINELKEKIKDKKFSNDYFKYNTETNEIALNDEENSLLCKDLLENNEYKLLKNQNKKLLQAINEILEKQPQPSPSGSNWKEVGKVVVDKNNITHIEYIFKDKTHYRIYYSFGDYTSKENNKNYSWQIINFYYQLDTNVLKNSLWISNNNVNADTEINIYNNRIMWGMGRDYIFKKLEELQE